MTDEKQQQEERPQDEQSSPPKRRSSLATTTSSHSAPYKKVDFDQIEVYEFPYILGDNPAVSSGAPIALGTELLHYESMELEVYEFGRSKTRRRAVSHGTSGRKRSSSMILPVQTRAQLLLSEGYSIESIASATLEADTISRERSASASKVKWDGVNEMSERFGRFFRRSVARRGSGSGSTGNSGSSPNSMPKKQSVAANSA